MPAIKNQESALAPGEQIRERDGFARFVGQTELRRFLSDLGGAGRAGHLFDHDKDRVEKEEDNERTENSQDRSKNPTAERFGLLECPLQAKPKQHASGTEEQEINPRKIASAGKLHEEGVTPETGQDAKKAKP